MIGGDLTNWKRTQSYYSEPSEYLKLAGLHQVYVSLEC